MNHDLFSHQTLIKHTILCMYWSLDVFVCLCQNGEGEFNYVYRVCENQYKLKTPYTIILSFLSQYSVSGLPVLLSGVILLTAKRLFGTGSQNGRNVIILLCFFGRMNHGAEENLSQPLSNRCAPAL